MVLKSVFSCSLNQSLIAFQSLWYLPPQLPHAHWRHAQLECHSKGEKVRQSKSRKYQSWQEEKNQHMASPPTKVFSCLKRRRPPSLRYGCHWWMAPGKPQIDRLPRDGRVPYAAAVRKGPILPPKCPHHSQFCHPLTSVGTFSQVRFGGLTPKAAKYFLSSWSCVTISIFQRFFGVDKFCWWSHWSQKSWQMVEGNSEWRQMSVLNMSRVEIPSSSSRCQFWMEMSSRLLKK